MPAEIRHIIFTEPEILGALSEYRKRRTKPLPSSEDVEVTISDEPRIRVTLAIIPKGKKMPLNFIFEGEELAAALIMFCIERRIPLPATGVSKTIQLVGNSITLQILKDVTREQIEAMSYIY